MSSSRIVRALAAGKLVITNREKVSVGLEIRNTDEATGKVHKHVQIVRPGITWDITRMSSIEDLRKSRKLQHTLSRRRIFIHDTWTEDVKR